MILRSRRSHGNYLLPLSARSRLLLTAFVVLKVYEGMNSQQIFPDLFRDDTSG